MDATAWIDIGDLVAPNPNRYNRPCIKGTGMSVRAVAGRYLRGESPEYMHDDLPDIPLSHFYAAVAYYLLNRERFDAELKAVEEENIRLEAEWMAERANAV
jgi:uncharacterized protein (DUF433 family)